MGFFSAKYRKLAKESLTCVGRRLTLRPCNTGFSEKTRAIIMAKIMKRSILGARIFNKYFEVFSWAIFILMLGSLFYSGKGIYNFYVYGSCNGLNSSSFCVFDPMGANNEVSVVKGGKPEECTIDGKLVEKNLNQGTLNLADYPNINKGLENKMIFIGCYSCDYTRKTYPLIQELLKKEKIDYTFIHFSVKPETDYLNDYLYCAYQEDQEKFWQFNDALFMATLEQVASVEYVRNLITEIGYDLTKIDSCRNKEETKNMIERQKQEIIDTGLYGTPTIFINDKYFVGPKPYRVYKQALK